MNTYAGSCFCGEVTIELTGEPVAMGYCHCESCRRWSAAPVTAFSLWPPSSVRVSRGAENLKSYSKTGASVRRWCALCGGHVLAEHPGLGLVDVYPAAVAALVFRPALHVHVSASVIAIADPHPRFKDMPVEMGGSGEMPG